jgi:hypothetical protein
MAKAVSVTLGMTYIGTSICLRLEIRVPGARHFQHS